jgi:multidrug efflux pump subunit AcrA (membrane-fusion protein)
MDADKLPGARVVRRAAGLTVAVFAGLIVIALIVSAFVSINVTVDAPGMLEPVRLWPVRSRESGVLAEILVSAGDTVRVGQVVARLDPLALNAASMQLRSQIRQRLIDSAKSTASLPLEDTQRAEQVAQAEARLVRARAALRQKLADHGFGDNVDSTLAVHRIGTHVDLDLAVADVRTAEADVRSARAQRDITSLGRFDAPRFAADLAQLRDQLSLAESRSGRLAITAPAAGVVLTEELERLTGTGLREGDELLEIADISRWQVTLTVGERSVREVRVGDSVKVEVPALRLLDRRLIPGRVRTIAREPVGASPAARAGTGGSLGAPAGAYRIVADLDASVLTRVGIEHLRKGYTVDAKIITRSGRILGLVRDYFAERLHGAALP